MTETPQPITDRELDEWEYRAQQEAKPNRTAWAASRHSAKRELCLIAEVRRLRKELDFWHKAAEDEAEREFGPID